MSGKEEFYKYGESLGIKINDLQRLKMLADNCQEDMATILFNISFLVNESQYTEHSRLTDIKDYLKSLNKQD